jgi:hypothetical protein
VFFENPPAFGFRSGSRKRSSLIVSTEGCSHLSSSLTCRGFFGVPTICTFRETADRNDSRRRGWAFSHRSRNEPNPRINQQKGAERNQAPFRRPPRSGVSRATHGRDARVPAPRAVRERRVAMGRRVGSRRRAEVPGVLDVSPSHGACDRPTKNISRLRDTALAYSLWRARAASARRFPSPRDHLAILLFVLPLTPECQREELADDRVPFDDDANAITDAPRITKKRSPSPCPRCPPR